VFEPRTAHTKGPRVWAFSRSPSRTVRRQNDPKKWHKSPSLGTQGGRIRRANGRAAFYRTHAVAGSSPASSIGRRSAVGRVRSMR
jgi:hypothetical protein